MVVSDAKTATEARGDIIAFLDHDIALEEKTTGAGTQAAQAFQRGYVGALKLTRQHIASMSIDGKQHIEKES